MRTWSGARAWRFGARLLKHEAACAHALEQGHGEFVHGPVQVQRLQQHLHRHAVG